MTSIARLSVTHGLRACVPCRYDAKCKRIQAESPHGRRPAWAVRPVIVKSGDDCRQELLAVQLISTFHDIFLVILLCFLSHFFPASRCRGSHRSAFVQRPICLCFLMSCAAKVINGSTLGKCNNRPCRTCQALCLMTISLEASGCFISVLMCMAAHLCCMLSVRKQTRDDVYLWKSDSDCQV